jgi:hypothetical protein
MIFPVKRDALASMRVIRAGVIVALPGPRIGPTVQAALEESRRSDSDDGNIAQPRANNGDYPKAFVSWETRDLCHLDIG